MKTNDDRLRQMESDLSLNTPYIKGKRVPVFNCWHFYSDGNAIDRLFDDKQDFTAGMNRIFVVSHKYKVIILAFVLMDTHVHFILHGNFNECNAFTHEYLRLTSKHIAQRHKENQKLKSLPISHQLIDNDYYLKKAICYVIKNAPAGGLPYNSWDYPWGSGALYFRKQDLWTSPFWTSGKHTTLSEMSFREKRELLKTRELDLTNAKVINGLVFPGEYVAYDIVEKIFRTNKSFNWILCTSKEEDIESKGGTISHLSIPIQEMRQHRNTLCKEIFGVATVRTLSTQDRLKLAKILHSKYNSSIKQIARLCGLVHEEIKNLI